MSVTWRLQEKDLLSSGVQGNRYQDVSYNCVEELRALAVFPMNQSLVANTHISPLTIACSSSHPLLASTGICMHMCARKHTHAHAHTRAHKHTLKTAVDRDCELTVVLGRLLSLFSSVFEHKGMERLRSPPVHSSNRRGRLPCLCLIVATKAQPRVFPE